jgi:hypothetical protein
MPEILIERGLKTSTQGVSLGIEKILPPQDSGESREHTKQIPVG